MTNERQLYRWIQSQFEDYDFDDQLIGPKRAFCKACGRLSPQWFPRPLEAVLTAVDTAIYIFCIRHGRWTVLHRDLWVQLQPHWPDAVPGPVSLRSAGQVEPSPDWVAVCAPPAQSVVIRGSYMPAHRVCPVCHAQLYYCPHDPHLIAGTIPSETPVFYGSGNEVVIAESLARSLDWSMFPDMKYDVLDVRDRPGDGLRLLGDPDWDAMP